MTVASVLLWPPSAPAECPPLGTVASPRAHFAQSGAHRWWLDVQLWRSLCCTSRSSGGSEIRDGAPPHSRLWKLQSPCSP